MYVKHLQSSKIIISYFQVIHKIYTHKNADTLLNNTTIIFVDILHLKIEAGSM